MLRRWLAVLTMVSALLLAATWLHPRPDAARDDAARDDAALRSGSSRAERGSGFGMPGKAATEAARPLDDLLVARGHDPETYELLRMFVDTLDQVQHNYVQDVDRRELLEAAIEGMLSKLDEHSVYIAADEIDRFRTDVEAEFGGIGVQVSKPTPQDDLRISNVLPDTPASRAGIVAGDVITAVAGSPIGSLPLTAAVQQLKGPVGTRVEIIVRHADGETQQVEIEREVIRVATVLGHHRQPDGTWDYLLDPDAKLAYVRITAFARHTHEELRDVLDDLQRQGIHGLVLDLRLNPGGLLASAIEVSDLFVGEGEIVRTSGRNMPDESYRAHADGTFDDFPVAVLVNRFSASASEIVAACLQDHGRAVIVGERTYGKGSVQNVVEMDGGRSALKLTTAHYLRPNGKPIHRFAEATDADDWGVSPDPGFEIPQTLRDLRELVLVQAEHEAGTSGHSVIEFEDTTLEKAVEYLTVADR